jgi:hypothetical protein
MKPLLSVVLWVLLALPLASCEGVVLGRDASGDATAIFDHLWNDLRERYPYFEVKEIDWVAAGNRHRKRVVDGMPEKELFAVLADLLFELRDGHVNLTSDFDRSRNWDWFEDYPLDYNQGVIDRSYLGRDFWITGPLHNQIIDGVLYVNYRSFMDEISDAHLDYLVERANGLRGVILDVRSNGGGSITNVDKLAAAFAHERYRYGKVRIKNGRCAGCFSSWNDLFVVPRDGRRYEGKVVVLTNRRSYSSTTYFAAMMRQNPRVTLVGSQTGGGGGTPAYGELPNGWIYRFSSTQTVNEQGDPLELGVPVDAEVALLPEDEYNGIDTIIEHALRLFE